MWLIYLFHFIIPVSVTCFLLQVLCVAVCAWSVQQIVLYFNTSYLLASCSAFFVLVVFNNFTIGGNALLDNQLTCGNFAVAFCTLAFYFMFKKGWYAVAIFTGLASLFQVLAGLQVMMIIAFVYAITEKGSNNIVSLLKMLLVYLLVASPMLFPIVYLQMHVQPSEQSKLFYDILYRVRNPNHYLLIRRSRSAGYDIQ